MKSLHCIFVFVFLLVAGPVAMAQNSGPDKPFVFFNPAKAEYVVLYTDVSSGQTKPRLERYDMNGVGLGGVDIQATAQTANGYNDLAIDPVNNRAFFVWQGYWAGVYRIWGAMIDLMTYAVTEKGTLDSAGVANTPAVAFSTKDQKYLVIWAESLVVRGLHLDKDGNASNGDFALYTEGGGIGVSLVSLAYFKERDQFLAVWAPFDTGPVEQLHGVLRDVGDETTSVAGDLVVNKGNDVLFQDLYYDEFAKHLVMVWETRAPDLRMDIFDQDMALVETAVQVSDDVSLNQLPKVMRSPAGLKVGYLTAGGADLRIASEPFDGLNTSAQAVFPAPPTMNAFDMTTTPGCSAIFVAASGGSSPQSLITDVVGTPCAADLILSPNVVDFGSLNDGETSSGRISVMSRYALHKITSVTAEPDIFRVASQTCTAAGLGHDQTCVIDVEVKPNGLWIGPQTGTLKLLLDDGSNYNAALKVAFEDTKSVGVERLSQVAPPHKATGVDPAGAVLMWKKPQKAAATSYRVQVCTDVTRKDCVQSSQVIGD